MVFWEFAACDYNRRGNKENSNFAALNHKSGHNLGLRHATNWNTTQAGLTVSGPGQYTNYGNAFDMMGVGGDARYHFTAYAKERLGWLSPDQVTVVSPSNTYSPTVTARRVYLLQVPRDVMVYHPGRCGGGLDYFFYQPDDASALSAVMTVTILVTPTPFHWLYLPIALRF